MQPQSRRLVSGAMLAIAFVVAGACNRSPELPPFTGDTDFVLAHTEHNLGNIEPCSCNNRTKGGFPRRVTALNSLRENNRHVLVLDTGNSLFSVDRKFSDPQFFAQAKVKAKAIAKAMAATKIDAMVFGETDLLAGGDFFMETVKDAGLPLVVANVFDRETGKPMFERYRIFDLDGLKLAVVGLVATELHPIVTEASGEGGIKITQPNNKITLILEDRFERKNVKIEDPVKVLEDLMPELRGKSHLVAVLAHLPPKLTRDLPSLVPGIHFVVGNHVAGSKATFDVDEANGSIAFTASGNGITLGVGEFHVRGGSFMFHDYSPLDSARTVTPMIEEWLDGVRREYGNGDPDSVTAESLAAIDEQLAVRFRTQLGRLGWYRGLLANSDPAKDSHFKHYGFVLDGKSDRERPELNDSDDPAMLEFIRGYRASLKDLYDEKNTEHAKAIDPVQGAPHYVGAGVCAQCHRPQTEFWRATKHGHAWQTMLDYGVEYDLECITCHTVGFMLPGGFDRPDRVRGFENVQCENCHGPGSAHIENILSSSLIVNTAAQMQCENCHNKEHSPNFLRKTYVPRATCPPLDPREPMIRDAYGNLRGEYERILARKGAETNRHIYTSLLDVYLRLERWQDAIDLVPQAIERQPMLKKGMTIGLARALDATGDTAGALKQLGAIFDEFKTDPKLVAAICDLLIHGRAPEARDLAQAAALVDYAMATFKTEEEGVFRLFQAEIEYARGERDAAIDTLLRLSKKSSLKGTIFLEKLRSWIAEREAELENAAPPPIPIPPQ